MGDGEPWQVRPWASVWRVPAPAGVLWLKRCAPAQAFEPALTAALASRRPALLPRVAAWDRDEAWLLLHDHGEPLGFAAGLEPWPRILALYAELQREEAAHAGEHLAAGVPDRRLARFPELYEELLRRELPGGGPLRRFAPRFAELCAALDELPPTIQHDDLHGGNVYPDGAAYRILDWGDACISHPFLTLHVALDHLDTPDERSLARLRDAYLEPWGGSRRLREAFDLALALGPFAHLFKELRVLDAIPPAQRAELGPDLPRLVADCIAVTCFSAADLP